MNGRSLHDAVLRVLTNGQLRRGFLQGDPEAVRMVGADEAAILLRSDPERLERMARFMARHFYRERIVRLFRYGRALALSRGRDPLAVLEASEFRRLLDSVILGSPASADAVARLVEERLHTDLAEWAFAGALVHYEGTLFRVEAGPRRWHRGGGGHDGVPTRSPHARILDLEWDLAPLMSVLRRGDPAPASPPRQPAHFLVALSPEGRVTTVRCSAALSRFLDVLDGKHSVAEAAVLAGLQEADAGRLLTQLTQMGAVEWRGP